jgi:hypothetical protein
MYGAPGRCAAQRALAREGLANPVRRGPALKKY